MLLCRQGCQAFLDTGTATITGPVDEIQSLNEKLGFIRNSATNRYEISCRKKSSLPDVNFTINGKLFPISADDYTLKVV